MSDRPPPPPPTPDWPGAAGRPAPGQVAAAVVVLGGAAFVAASCAYALAKPLHPLTASAATCLLPLALATGAAQYVATFRRSVAAAMAVTLCCAVLSLLFTLALLANAAETLVADVPLPKGIAWVFGVLAALVAAAAFALVQNYRWWRQLLRPVPPWLCATCGYDLRGSPGRCPECGATRGPSSPSPGAT